MGFFKGRTGRGKTTTTTTTNTFVNNNNNNNTNNVVIAGGAVRDEKEEEEKKENENNNNNNSSSNGRVLFSSETGIAAGAGNGAYELLIEGKKNSNGTTYSTNVASRLSVFSGWSYSNINTFCEKIGIDDRIGISNGTCIEISVYNDGMLIHATSQLVLSDDGRMAIICFRGTELLNVVNWFVDACARKVVVVPSYRHQDDDDDNDNDDMDIDDVAVHEGFLNNFESVWRGPKGILAHLLNPNMMSMDYIYDDDDDIEKNGVQQINRTTTSSSVPTNGNDVPSSSAEQQRLQQQQEQDEEEAYNRLEVIYITGHSLGGAMAVLAGMALERENPDLFRNKLKGIYTYGQPMAISDGRDREIVQRRIGSYIHRHVYYNDLAPHLPPLSVGSYDHVGNEYRYKPPPPQKNDDDDHDGWVLNKPGFLHRGRATQVLFISITGVVGIFDAIIHQIQWLSPFIKLPWSVVDHWPKLYIDSFWSSTKQKQ